MRMVLRLIFLFSLLQLQMISAGNLCAAEQVVYHQPPASYAVPPTAERLVDGIRHRFGLAKATLPEVDPGLMRIAADQAYALIETPDNARKNWQQTDLRAWLRAEGVSDYHVTGSYVIAADMGRATEKLLTWIEKQTSGGFNRLGVSILGGDGAAIAVALLTRRNVQLDPIPSFLDKPGSIALAGRLAIGLTNPIIYTTDPAGYVTRQDPVTIASGSFNIMLDLKNNGRYAVEVVADSGRGPQVAALMHIVLGRDSKPRTLPKLDWPEKITEKEHAQAVYQWINAFRENYKLNPLRFHAGLAEAEKVVIDNLGKVELTHKNNKGLGASTYLEEHKIHVLAFGENLGRHVDPQQLMQRVVESPSHRRNLLMPGFTDVGVVVRQNKKSGIWTIGQLFARMPDQGRVRVGKFVELPKNLFAKINSKRRRIGLEPIVHVSSVSSQAKTLMRSHTINDMLDTHSLKRDMENIYSKKTSFALRMVTVLSVSNFEELASFSGFLQPRWTLTAMALRTVASGFVAIVVLGEGEVLEEIRYK